MKRLRWVVAASLLGLVALAREAGPAYPPTRRGDTVEDYHGTRIADPYRWLEQEARTSEEVRAWVEAENQVTFAYLGGIAERDAIRQRLTTLWNYERYSSPRKIGGRYYFSKNDGLQAQSVLYTVDALDGTPQVLIDPNGWSQDGTVALDGVSYSEDGRYLAYARSAAGSDWEEWFVRDLTAGSDLSDRLRWVKFTEPAWTRDGKGFFYTRFDAPPSGQEFQALNKNQKLCYHRVGTPQADDVLVYERPDQPEWGFSPSVSEDGRYLVIAIWKGTAAKYRIVYRDLLEPYGMPIELIDNFDAEYTFVGNDGPVLYFKTDLDAPRGRLVAIDTRAPEREKWRDVVPQSEHALGGVDFVGNLFICSYLRDAVSYVRMFRPDGSHVRDVSFPGIGTASGFGGRRSDLETFYSYSSYNTPPVIYRYDLVSGESKPWKRAKVSFDPEAYAVEQVFFTSKDGTRVPMFLAHRKDVRADGDRPTLLTGYGGFSISVQPRFSVERLVWMEMGGLLAVPNLRGGGEYGEAWHLAGTKLHKQNVFDDFIAAAEWLTRNNWTRPQRLAIQGGSNGGLLVGACMTQRPELFGAALPAVGVMDMLRFHRFTAGRYWVDDYGSADDPAEFKALAAYSPYHNIKPGVKYPATLVTTADTDDRVVPGHSFKFAAALQRAQAGEAPVLIRIETRAGHGGGKPTQKQIEEVADEWAFLVKSLSMHPAGPIAAGAGSPAGASGAAHR
ncbi:MAG TPA: prolyl oligopeptidase family serine peptidase [Candidatus Polarisedimenticolaceae bacterium]|nr:prolyl oligopeptidase family serine peptidase [Candidatus Polarisedimenticolaceae bacterium]